MKKHNAIIMRKCDCDVYTVEWQSLIEHSGYNESTQNN